MEEGRKSHVLLGQLCFSTTFFLSVVFKVSHRGCAITTVPNNWEKDYFCELIYRIKKIFFSLVRIHCRPLQICLDLWKKVFEVTVSETELPLHEWEKVGSSGWRDGKFLPQTAAWLPGRAAEQGHECKSESVNSPTLFSIVSTKGSNKSWCRCPIFVDEKRVICSSPFLAVSCGCGIL